MSQALERPTWGRSPLALLFWLVLVFGAAALGGWLTSQSVGTWYQTLEKPAFNPPDWIFGPVWTVLYALMGIAAWLLNRKRSVSEAPSAFAWFYIQLALNVLWSGLFFAMQSPGAALVCIGFLLVAIAATMRAFFQISPLASWLLAPYLAWVSFATVLNATLWWLN